LTSSLFSIIHASGITVLLLLELRSATFRRMFLDARRMRRNAAYLATGLGAGLLLHWLVTLLTPQLPKLSWQAPLWVHLLGVFLLAELFSWLLHWAKHENDFMWRLHCQHHRDDRFTPWLVANTYAPEMVLSGVMISGVVLAVGFDPFALDVYLLFYALANLYQHSSLPYSLGWLDALVINPAYHRQHHGGARLNYGSTLSVWDWAFRTVAWPRDRRDATEPPAVDSSPEPFGFVAEMLYPLQPKRWAHADDYARVAAHYAQRTSAMASPKTRE
jgi:sterol desaturase/sphingolipid hydroxylase (fatty acid hydroxylase superfamily)